MSECYVIITWPQVQEYMDKKGFDENSHLVINEPLYDLYGDSAYFISSDWLNNLEEE